ncbi:MAG TPA: ATP-binding cassette domain-containing protein [Dehalococcoidia bacterium]|nr:ATP-binding cassette domain-containing protein [Dehalococcoidia bacterium]
MEMPESGWAVKAEDLWFAYHSDLWAVKGVGLTVPWGAFLMVLGPSGAGKTTLLKLLSGLLRPCQGRVELLGHATDNGFPPKLRPRVGYIPQQLGLVRSMTALENVLMGALGRQRGLGPLFGLFPNREMERAKECLALLGIAHKARAKVYQLSGGERQRVAIARTLLQGPAIVFADEFVSDLDLPRAAEVIGEMRDIGSSEGITFVINMHELSLVQEFGDDIIIVRDGMIVHQGVASDVTWSMLQEVPA